MHVNTKVLESACMSTPARRRSPEEVFVSRLKELIKDGEAKSYGARARVNPQTLSKWRTGKLIPNPKLTTLIRLANALHVSVASLISEDTEDTEVQYTESDIDQTVEFAKEAEERMKGIRELFESKRRRG